MERRTRSSTAREAALLAASIQDVKPATKQTASKTGKKKAAKPKSNNGGAKKQQSTLSGRITKGKTTSKKSKTEEPVSPQPPVINELPHNLGPSAVPSALAAPDGSRLTKEDPEEKPAEQANLDKLANDIQVIVDKSTQTLQEPGKKKPTKKLPYGLTPGYSPFPEWARPTPEECEEVNKLLSSVHGQIIPPTTIPAPSLTVTGCGEVPCVLDALIRTLLSGATTGKNSAMAFNGLVQRFGILEEGVGKGSVNWDAVRQAPLEDVFEAIKRGGLADIKSKHLKGILDMVYKENQERKDALLKEGLDGQSTATDTNINERYEIACADQNFLSLNHFHSLPTEQAMAEFVKYPGIGPKTAACVILFCLQRPCFAVDTHVFRLCKWLGWIPSTKVNEITAFSHMEVRVPDHLKYSLHQLFILHGKSCPRCRAITGESAVGWDDGCVIDHLVTRVKKKDAPTPQNGKKAARQKRIDEESTEESDD